jgi:hypothetical protein
VAARIRDLCEVHRHRCRAVRLIAAKGWSTRFDDPIPLPRGRQLVTLKDAGQYITKLPKAEHDTERAMRSAFAACFRKNLVSFTIARASRRSRSQNLISHGSALTSGGSELAFSTSARTY